MANVLAGGGDGMMGQFPLEQWFYEMPVCTRWWMTAALSASVLVQCHIISPFQLFYSFRTVFYRSQVSLPGHMRACMHRLTKSSTGGS
jgi:Derlin-2/3